jgi:hypothetical protein
MKYFLFILFFINLLFAKNENGILTYHEAIADYYYRILDYSTSFLYDKSNYEYIKKHNKLRLYIDNSIDDMGNLNSSLSIRANVRLPKISKNLYFTIDKDSNNLTKNEKKSELYQYKENSRIGLKYFFLKESDQEIYAKLGGRINLKGNKYYLKLTANKTNNFEDVITHLYFNEYYYIKNKIFKSEVGIDFRKNLNKVYTFSQLNNITLDENSKTYISNTILIDQYLNKKSLLSYWTTVYTFYDNKYFETQNININLKYHYLLKKWIYLDVIPSIVKSFIKEKDIRSYLAINFGFIF